VSGEIGNQATQRASEGSSERIATVAGGMQRGRINKSTINADQVAWLLDIAGRYIPKDTHPSISRQHEMKKYGMLYEIMEIMGVGFGGENAAHNGSPPDCRYIEPEPEPTQG